MAKKKRRRRKDGNKAPQAEIPSAPSASDDLPDFDLPEDSEVSSSDLPEFDLVEDGDEEPTQASSARPKKMDLDTITDAMMGSTDAPVRSVTELIQDRKLEKAFIFEEDSDAEIPDFVELAQKSSTASTVDEAIAPMGKKRVRQAARRAAAIEAKEQEGGDLKEALSNVPFITDEKGEVNAIKILEFGAWLGIGLLVLWEFYINSPLFDRSGPMAPVVFEFFY